MPESNPQNHRLGYARVSTYGQTLAAQLEQLRADGCAKIFREKVTGTRADRRELLKLLKAITPGDVVTVTRIDRLARSTFDLFAIVKQIVDAGRSIPLTGGAVGRHRHKHRTPDDCRSRRAGGRGGRSYPHTHSGRQEPGEGTRAAYGPTAEAHAAAAARSTAAAGAKAKRLRNWRRATTSASRRFRGCQHKRRSGKADNMEQAGGGTLGSRQPREHYWAFVCNPKKWAVDDFLRSGEAEDSWAVDRHAKHQIPDFGEGQLAVVRVGLDSRNRQQLHGNSPLKAEVYAVCEILSGVYDGPGGRGKYTYDKELHPKGWPTVRVRYIRSYLENPLLIDDLRREAPDLDARFLMGPRTASIPLSQKDFRKILSLLKEFEDTLRLPGFNVLVQMDEAREREARQQFADIELLQRARAGGEMEPERRLATVLHTPVIQMWRQPLSFSREASAIFAVRPDGAVHQWREVPPRELSIALVADERFGRVTGWIEAS